MTFVQANLSAGLPRGVVTLRAKYFTGGHLEVFNPEKKKLIENVIVTVKKQRLHLF